MRHYAIILNVLLHYLLWFFFQRTRYFPFSFFSRLLTSMQQSIDTSVAITSADGLHG